MNSAARSHWFRTAAASAALMLALLPATTAAQAPKSDSAAVLDVVQRLFDAMARRDTVGARALLVRGGSFFSMRTGGAPVVRQQADTTFLRSLAAGGERMLERMWNPQVRIHGPLAEVWAPYDFHRDGRFSHCGVDSFNLMRTAAGWQLVTIVYTVETTGCA